MNKIAKIIAKRDGMTMKEANDYVKGEMKGVMEYMAEGDYNGAEDYFQDVFGLEPDYLLEVMI